MVYAVSSLLLFQYPRELLIYVITKETRKYEKI
jgi:hypothetical protein